MNEKFDEVAKELTEAFDKYLNEALDAKTKKDYDSVMRKIAMLKTGMAVFLKLTPPGYDDSKVAFALVILEMF